VTVHYHLEKRCGLVVQGAFFPFNMQSIPGLVPGGSSILSRSANPFEVSKMRMLPAMSLT
jgi:hypothetical protein